MPRQDHDDMKSRNDIEETCRALDNIAAKREDAARDEERQRLAAFARGLRRAAEADVTATPAHVQGRLAALALVLEHLAHRDIKPDEPLYSPEGDIYDDDSGPEPTAAAPLGAGPRLSEREEGRRAGLLEAADEARLYAESDDVDDDEAREALRQLATDMEEAAGDYRSVLVTPATPPPQGEAAGVPEPVWMTERRKGWASMAKAWAKHLREHEVERRANGDIGAADALKVAIEEGEAVFYMGPEQAPAVREGEPASPHQGSAEEHWTPERLQQEAVKQGAIPPEPHQGSGTAEPSPDEWRDGGSYTIALTGPRRGEVIERRLPGGGSTPTPPGGPSGEPSRFCERDVTDDTGSRTGSCDRPRGHTGDCWHDEPEDSTPAPGGPST